MTDAAGTFEAAIAEEARFPVSTAANCLRQSCRLIASDGWSYLHLLSVALLRQGSSLSSGGVQKNWPCDPELLSA